jgi:NhaA family Na+:H+ antiporter
LNLLNVLKLSLYVVVGVFIWVCVLKSGVHATLAGVAVGFAIPLARHEGEAESLLERTEHAHKPWVSYAIGRFLLSPMRECRSLAYRSRA